MKTMCLPSKKKEIYPRKQENRKANPHTAGQNLKKVRDLCIKKQEITHLLFHFFDPPPSPTPAHPLNFPNTIISAMTSTCANRQSVGKKHENPSVTVPLTSSYANQRCCRHSQTAIALSIDADFPLGGATSTPIAADGGDPFPANAADPAFQIPSDTYSDSYLLVKYVQFRWL